MKYNPLLKSFNLRTPKEHVEVLSGLCKGYVNPDALQEPGTKRVKSSDYNIKTTFNWLVTNGHGKIANLIVKAYGKNFTAELKSYLG